MIYGHVQLYHSHLGNMVIQCDALISLACSIPVGLHCQIPFLHHLQIVDKNQICISNCQIKLWLLCWLPYLGWVLVRPILRMHL